MDAGLKYAVDQEQGRQVRRADPRGRVGRRRGCRDQGRPDLQRDLGRRRRRLPDHGARPGSSSTRSRPTQAKADALKAFLKYILTDGQKLATEVDYAPLPRTSTTRRSPSSTRSRSADLIPPRYRPGGRRFATATRQYCAAGDLDDRHHATALRRPPRPGATTRRVRRRRRSRVPVARLVAGGLVLVVLGLIAVTMVSRSTGAAAHGLRLLHQQAVEPARRGLRRPRRSSAARCSPP